MIASLKNVSKSIKGKKIVEDISLELEEGKIHAVLGPNGAGKTTTIRLLTGILEASSGEVEVFGKTAGLPGFDAVRQDTGVQNDGNLYENLTVRKNLYIWGSFYKLPLDIIEKRTKELLLFFDLEDRIDATVGSLSKGMKQKVLIIRALIHNPKLLILDEPTSGLDPETSEMIINHLKQLAQQKNITVLMCTHQLHGLEDITDKLILMKEGRFILSGAAKELIKEEWPYLEFEIMVNLNKGIEELFKMNQQVIDYTVDSKGISVRVINRESIPIVLADLVDNNYKVYSVVEKKKTIRDLYFRKIGVHVHD